jgi:hypothetical protein
VPVFFFLGPVDSGLRNRIGLDSSESGPIAEIAKLRYLCGIMSALRKVVQCGGILALVTVSTCDDPTGLTELLGLYVSTSFVTTANGVSTDQVARGASVSITLFSNNSASGLLLIPAGDGQAGADVDLRGAWERNGDLVTFRFDEDTFLEELEFAHGGRDLIADKIIGHQRIQLTLSRPGPR